MVKKNEIGVRYNEPVCDEEPLMKYEDENVSEGETVLISDIIKDKKRKLFSLCDYDAIVIHCYAREGETPFPTDHPSERK